MLYLLVTDLGAESMEDRDLLALLRGPIGSVRSLELLFLLRRTAPERWVVERLVKELRSSRTQVDSALERLTIAGLINSDDAHTYAYSPATSALGGLCDALAALYRERPVQVIAALFSSEDRLRSFAEAFRLKGEGE